MGAASSCKFIHVYLSVKLNDGTLNDWKDLLYPLAFDMFSYPRINSPCSFSSQDYVTRPKHQYTIYSTMAVQNCRKEKAVTLLLLFNNSSYYFIIIFIIITSGQALRDAQQKEVCTPKRTNLNVFPTTPKLSVNMALEPSVNQALGLSVNRALGPMADRTL